MPRDEVLARDKKYLAWIRTQKCAVSGASEEVVAHHLTIFANRGIGQKPSDYWCIPLRHDVHRHLHSVGEKEFWSQLGKTDPHMIAAEYLGKYMEIDLACGLDILRLLNGIAIRLYDV